jgi:predicted PhzF superfamily epimerase YddE/YHI9
VQECAAGLINVRREDDGALSFAAPDPVVTDLPFGASVLARLLGGVVPSAPLVIEVGPQWLTGRVSTEELDGLQIDVAEFLRLVDLKLTGVNLYAVDDDRRVHVRSFFVGGGVLTEDPFCGSGNAAVAVHLLRTGRAGDVPPTYQARQGSHRGRDGRITVTLGDGIWVGGQSLTVVSGNIAV